MIVVALLVAQVGPPPKIAVARVGLTAQGGGTVATLRASTTTQGAYLADVRRLTGNEVTLGQPNGSGLPPAGESATIDHAGHQQRAASARLPGSTVTLTMVTGIPATGFFSSSP